MMTNDVQCVDMKWCGRKHICPHQYSEIHRQILLQSPSTQHYTSSLVIMLALIEMQGNIRMPRQTSHDYGRKSKLRFQTTGHAGRLCPGLVHSKQIPRSGLCILEQLSFVRALV